MTDSGAQTGGSKGRRIMKLDEEMGTEEVVTRWGEEDEPGRGERIVDFLLL